MDCCAQAKLYLWAAQEVDVMENSVDEDKKGLLGLRTTVTEMLDS